eukprot:767104-Hanusia_phi.AAC.1
MANYRRAFENAISHLSLRLRVKLFSICATSAFVINGEVAPLAHVQSCCDPGSGPSGSLPLRSENRGVSRPGVQMRLSNGQKVLIELPTKLENVHLMAKSEVRRVQEEVVEKQIGGLTINTAGMGQAPFWVAVIGGLTVLKMVKQKMEGRSILDNKDTKYIPQTEEELEELHVFACGGCGYEMMPARGREGKFFPDNFKCPICGASKEEFWDKNDPNDPRNQEDEADKAKSAKKAS